jgi:hypothetical protein
MEGARTSFDEVGARDHPIARGSRVVQKNRKIEPPGLDFSWEMDNKGWERVEGGPMEGARTLSLVWLVHASSDRAWGAGWCRKAETEPPGLGFCWEMRNEGGRG